MCLKPWFNPKTGKTTPCGGCIGCRQDEMKLWTNRALNEKRKMGKAGFYTLTYDTAHLHYHESDTLPSLDKEAVKKFLDNLKNQLKTRKLPEGNTAKFKYILVGEYGGTFQRPHYHMLIMGLDWKEMKNEIQKIWKRGNVDAQPITQGRIKYVLSYTMKHLKGKLAEQMYDERGVERPFRLVSKGFGADYIKEHAQEINATGYIMSGNRKIIVPTYYKNLYYRYDEESILSREQQKLEILAKRRERANAQNMTLTEDAERERKAKQQIEIEKLRRQNQPIELEFINEWRESIEDILIQGEKLT